MQLKVFDDKKVQNPIPKRLKEARKKAKITQKNLGIKIGMDEGVASSRMNHYEKGRHVPDVSNLNKISKILGVPVTYFFCEDDLTAELSCLIDKLNESEKKELIALLKRKKS